MVGGGLASCLNELAFVLWFVPNFRFPAIWDARLLDEKSHKAGESALQWKLLQSCLPNKHDCNMWESSQSTFNQGGNSGVKKLSRAS